MAKGLASNTMEHFGNPMAWARNQGTMETWFFPYLPGDSNMTTEINPTSAESHTQVNSLPFFLWANFACTKNSLKEENGIVCIEPPVNFSRLSALNWINYCLAFPRFQSMYDFNSVKKGAFDVFGHVGLLHVYEHFGGYLVLRFIDRISMNNALRCSPAVLGHYEFLLRPWHECFPEPVYDKVRVWVQFSRVPFSTGLSMGCISWDLLLESR